MTETLSIDQKNALALQADLADLRKRLSDLEVAVTALQLAVSAHRKLTQDQSRVVGEAVARIMGSGSTVRDEV